MATEIRVWQVQHGQLEPVVASLQQEGRLEVGDLEKWIRSQPVLLGEDLAIVGEQVQTRSGPMDFLALDRSGNLVVVELKRDRLPREALAQALDYASDVASWDADKISEIFERYAQRPVDEFLGQVFPEEDLAEFTVNRGQRVLLVGFSVEEPLERMIEWLSGSFGVPVNAVVLTYVKTLSGDELIARTMIIPEELDRERAARRQFKIAMSDEPGRYDDEELRELLRSYLSSELPTPRRIREILLPLCLDKPVVTREDIKSELVRRGEAPDEGKAGTILTTISGAIGLKKRDYLRQVIAYDRPGPQSWEKDHYRIVSEYRELVQDVLRGLKPPGPRDDL
ncbi:MAG: hypothetical protein Kow00109_15090 [Acidobacteriota bacterium]